MMTEPTDVVAYLVDGGWECATCAAKSEADGALVYGVTRAEMEALDTQGARDGDPPCVLGCGVCDANLWPQMSAEAWRAVQIEDAQARAKMWQHVFRVVLPRGKRE